MGLARSGSAPEAPQNKCRRADWLDCGPTSPKGRACPTQTFARQKFRAPAKRNRIARAVHLNSSIIIKLLFRLVSLYGVISSLKYLCPDLQLQVSDSPPLGACSLRIRPSVLRNQHLISTHIVTNNRPLHVHHPLTPSCSPQPANGRADFIISYILFVGPPTRFCNSADPTPLF